MVRISATRSATRLPLSESEIIFLKGRTFSSSTTSNPASQSSSMRVWTDPAPVVRDSASSVLFIVPLSRSTSRTFIACLFSITSSSV